MKIKLNDRLKVMSKEASYGKVVADIGTDHGYLPIYMKSKGLAEKVIMCDISSSSLQKAIDTWKLVFSKEKGDFRVGDGLEVLDYGEADTVTIAGIGGILIKDILSWNYKKTLTIDRLVLQPRSHVALLRKYLYENGFLIEKEILVREGKFIWEILVAKVPDEIEKREPLDNLQYEYPDILLENKDKTLIKSYLEGARNKLIYIKESIESGITNQRELEDHIEYERVLSKISRIDKMLIKLRERKI